MPLWCCDVMHGINTKCLQCRVSEVFESIEYIVQFVVLSRCLDFECIPQLHHVIIFILWHHLILHIIITLLARGNEGIVQRII